MFNDHLSQQAEKINARTYLSQQHNLPSDESYQLIKLKDFDHTVILQYFKSYGEEGHELTYCIGNKNIPKFIQENIIKSMEQLEDIQSFRQYNTSRITPNQTSQPEEMRRLNWNFTFNFYTKATSGKLAGFPFHMDTPSNGEITAICTLQSSASLEMRKKGTMEPLFSFELTPRSLLLLTGESRWNWEHRVVPQEFKEPRISAVVGCSPSS